MSVPTDYTEEGFVLYLFNNSGLRPIWDSIGVTEATAAEALADVVIDTLIEYGTDDIATISGLANIGKLRKLGLVFAWRMIMANFAIDINYAADGESFSRDQLFQHAKDALSQAEADAAPYLSTYKAKSQIMKQNGPYTALPVDERSTLERWD